MSTTRATREIWRHSFSRDFLLRRRNYVPSSTHPPSERSGSLHEEAPADAGAAHAVPTVLSESRPSHARVMPEERLRVLPESRPSPPTITVRVT